MLHIIDRRNARSVPPNLCAFGIMTKAPQPGKVKTRLSPPLTPAEAAQLNTCFLRDISNSISQATRNASAKGVGIYTPVGEEAAYDNILPEDFWLISQRGDAFGERLIYAMADLFAVGFESVCLINSDSPAVSASTFGEAANELSKPGERIVLGPSEDGGYYLIGLKKNEKRLFEDIDWSTDRVLAQTKERAAETNMEIHELELGLDIDDQAALVQMCERLFAGGAKQTAAVETRKFLADLLEREGRERIWPK